jgi:hypothetical protein
MMMRVETEHQVLGYPVIAMAFFTFAVLAGVALAAWIVATDRQAARVQRGQHPE